MGTSKDVLSGCLYFTASSLARAIAKLADQEFQKTGMSPSHAFLLMVVVEEPGIGQKELAARLHLAPSTVTRFVDTLVRKGLIRRKAKGKAVLHFPTTDGKKAHKQVLHAWMSLYERYTSVLGKKAADKLTGDTFRAGGKLETHG